MSTRSAEGGGGGGGKLTRTMSGAGISRRTQQILSESVSKRRAAIDILGKPSVLEVTTRFNNPNCRSLWFNQVV